MAERWYSDDEVGRILRRATAPQEATSPDGMRADDVRRVAAELGLDPVAIDRAIETVDAERRTTTNPRVHAAFVEQTVDGEFSDEDWERCVTHLRRATGSVGVIDARGAIREWRGGSDLEFVHFQATVRNGQTGLSLMGDSSGASAMTTAFGLVSGIMLGLVPVVVSTKIFSWPAWLTFLLSAMVAATCVAAVRHINRTRRRSLTNRLETIMDHVTEVAPSTDSSFALRVTTPDESPARLSNRSG